MNFGSYILDGDEDKTIGRSFIASEYGDIISIDDFYDDSEGDRRVIGSIERLGVSRHFGDIGSVNHLLGMPEIFCKERVNQY